MSSDTAPFGTIQEDIMLETKISLNSNNACDNCGRKFRNEEKIYRFYENKKFYCDECADEIKAGRIVFANIMFCITML